MRLPLACAVLAVALVTACSAPAESEIPESAEVPESTYPGETPVGPEETTASGLKSHLIQAGSGANPTAGQTVAVHYSDYLLDGTPFDSSVSRGEPIVFTLGTGAVIAGWDEGIALMQVGEKRKLVIPAELGYGAAGSPPVIPPAAVLVFDVELVEIR